MKQEGKLDRCHLKGLIGDKIQALLVGVGHNFRMILRRLRVIYVYILAKVRSMLEKNKLENEGLNVVSQLRIVIGI